MQETSAINPTEFVAAVKPVLERRDMNALMRFCRQRWTSTQIAQLLWTKDCDTRKLAALALSLVGDRECVPALVEQLRDADPMLNQMAEHALWSVWFRLSTPEANQLLMRGVQLMSEQNLDSAIDHFNHAVMLDAKFAEAYNQRAIAYYLQEKFNDSLADCRAAVRCNPDHFGAWCGMGHSYAQLAECEKSIDAYKKALAINPHLECIGEAIAAMSSGHSDPCS